MLGLGQRSCYQNISSERLTPEYPLTIWLGLSSPALSLARACCGAVVYLVERFGWTAAKALSFVQHRRSDCDPERHVWKQLQASISTR